MDASANQTDMRSDNAVAFYGTLRPGEPNHWLVRKIPGTWVEAAVRGYLFEIGWGRYEGYPGFVADSSGHLVPISVLVSDDWPSHLAEVDEFEGPGYERRPLPIFAIDDGPSGGDQLIGEAQVYVFLTDWE